MDKKSILNLEIHDGFQWRRLGFVTLLENESLGLNAKTEFVFDFDHAERFVERSDLFAPSCLVPVSFEPKTFDGWPPFLLDLFPQGAALKYVVDHYRIADRPENYWRILKKARLNPPGNVRVVVEDEESPKENSPDAHMGFSRSEVVDKGPNFLEHMVRCGAPVTGTTGAGGAAPKFLLREDYSGRFHADGALSDEKTKSPWLVKFPRGRSLDDRDILRSEKILMEIASELGFTSPKSVSWENNCLFVSRFDRLIGDKTVVYLGLESFYSLVGHCDFGSRLQHETYLRALARFGTEPKRDCIEYVLRDFFNVMVGNTDNHGRNSSVLKGDGWVRLAPIYDIAPMKFDPEGLVRSTRWGDEGNIGAISKLLHEVVPMDVGEFKSHLNIFYDKVTRLVPRMKELGLPDRYINGTSSDRQFMQECIGSYLGKTHV